MPSFRKRPRALFYTPLVVLALVGLMAGKGPAHERLNVAYASAAALKGSLLSPRDVEFETVRVTDAGAACMQYRVEERGEGRAWAVVLGTDVARSDARDGRFQVQWDRQCLGLAHDVTRAVDRFF
jgi:hypothetical protein